jgi:hypothetical protein
VCRQWTVGRRLADFGALCNGFRGVGRDHLGAAAFFRAANSEPRSSPSTASILLPAAKRAAAAQRGSVEVGASFRAAKR